MTLFPKRLLIAAIACALTALTQAAIIYDFSPDAIGADIIQTGDSGPITNISTGPNWVDHPDFPPLLQPGPTRLTGMDLYTRKDFVEIGTDVLIRFLKVTPTGLELTEFETAISIIDKDGITTRPCDGSNNPNDEEKDHVRAFADFGDNDIMLDGSVFLIGMSGVYTNIGAFFLDWDSFPDTPDLDGYVYNWQPADTEEGPLVDYQGNADLAFRLHGTTSVPDSSSSAALLGIALTGLLTFRRFRQR